MKCVRCFGGWRKGQKLSKDLKNELISFTFYTLFFLAMPLRFPMT